MSPSCSVALCALHRDHDVQAAIRQLEAYHLRFPSGDLAEEALALTIEALSAFDDRAAQTFADEYRRRFPRGRFREEVQRAQQRFQERGLVIDDLDSRAH